ncbi:5-(carboxyamino)imidazole ribonucleotide synthase [Oceanobacillus halophilus]|uniref:N5-carboxyaminoimidazole ribonucleotide synthase n=1 Tax=Oceanobacillus halophilus TaxID=930130 RepID=A0A495A4J3_9BACI|nr:5-(carboxyamino)imidazole ribonucleotide synthase [Oceanobacillus halophilus]RKQ34607.1 5-(carboxyamino)imidazole ribonucleotide synthase [Oceanobacillus halophilus]
MQINKPILPPQTVGIIGGGQLGRMMAIAARYMGYQIAVLDPTPNCPTAQVADTQITAAYDDMDAIKQLTDLSDVVTYEFENVDLEAATFIEEQGKLPQGSNVLGITQNRENEKTLMRKLNLPIAEFSIVSNAKECEEALKQFTLPAVIKTCSGGYDGKGQLKINSKADIEQAKAFADKYGSCILEQWITFDKEISVVFTRSQSGEIAYFPIAENEHRDHILFQTMAPAKVNAEVQIKANEAARVLAEEMNIVGTFAIEMFVKNGDIYLNEMAPRPHNSGHYTIEACNISQFGQHIRAICGLPLMPIIQFKPAIMRNILGEDMEPVLRAMPNSEEGFVHLYGKDEAKVKRKMGHITFTADTENQLFAKVEKFEEAK